MGLEDSLEKEIALHFNILAWEIPWTEEPAGLQSTGPHNLAAKQQQHIQTQCLAHATST